MATNVTDAMGNIYHENEMNSTNATNKNGKENGNGSIPEISERKFSEKKKEDNRKKNHKQTQQQ